MDNSVVIAGDRGYKALKGSVRKYKKRLIK